MKIVKILVVIVLALLILISCGKKKPGPPKEVDEFACNDTERVLAKEYVTLDKNISSDGNGSIKIETKEPLTVRFYEVKLPGENSKYTFKVKMKSAGLKDSAYLAMDINYPGGGKQSVQSDTKDYLYGDNDWTPMSITISAPNQKAASVILYVVLTNEGTVWVDDLHLIVTPLG
ncbi:MAG: hypothetical protein N2445_04320 [Acidobacteria bacterium]|nr:hypothetical protein [Acidobacteriota bacterium]